MGATCMPPTFRATATTASHSRAPLPRARSTAPRPSKGGRRPRSRTPTSSATSRCSCREGRTAVGRFAAMRRIVAIDGPSGAGKSTVARAVAEALGVPTLDTGAMYRAITLAALERDVPIDDPDPCGALARSVQLSVDGTVLLDGRDVTAQIRGPDVTAAVSTVSSHPSVRTALVAHQRTWADEHDGGVVEGRDIGTVVFPDAAVKVFLTASDEARARRRQHDEA